MDAPTANPRYIAMIAFISASVLGLGVFFKPKKPDSQPVVTEQEKTRLQKLVQKRALEDIATYLSDTAAAVAPHLVRLRQPEATAVVWNADGLVVTAAASPLLPPLVTLLTAAAAEIPAETAVSGPGLPVAALRARPEVPLPPVTTLRADTLRPGQWLIAAWRQANGAHAFVAGLFSETTAAACSDFSFREVLSSLHLSTEMLGGGLFDLNGNLAGLIVPCGEHAAAMVVSDVEAALKSGASPSGRILGRYGMKLADMDDLARSYFKAAEGVLVTEVWEGSLAASAGLGPGDVIVAVNGEPALGVEELEEVLEPAAQGKMEFRIRRGAQGMRVALAAGGAASPSAESVSGLVLRPQPSGYPIESVIPGSRAAKAGIRPGDRLVRVDGAEVRGVAAAQKAMARNNGQPSFLVLERAGRKWGAFLK